MVINLQALKDLKEQRNFANISQFEIREERSDNSSSTLLLREIQIYKGKNHHDRY